MDVVGLVGRERELAVLCRAARQSPALVQVEGEAGVGKSRLVREVVDSVSEGRTVLVGWCQRFPEPLVLGPVVEAVRHARDALAMRGDLNQVTSVLRPVLPELADVLPDGPPRTGGALDWHVLFRAIREVLAALGPALLVIEDVHWADPETLDFLRFTMTDPPPDLTLVVTYRREEAPNGVPLGMAYRPGAGVTRRAVRLEPLGVGEVRALASGILGGGEISAEHAARLHRLTGGLPMVVEEVLGSLPDDDQVPPRVRDDVVEQVARLSAGARRLVHAASVFTAPASIDFLSAVADLSGGRLLTAVGEALGRAVLHETEGGTYSFRHAFARRAVYGSLSALERKELHARALPLLAGLASPPLAELAEHARIADAGVDWSRHAEAAADEALAALDGATAGPLLLRLLAEPSLDTADVDRLAVKLAEAALLDVDTPGFVPDLKRLLLDARLSPRTRGELRMRVGLLLSLRADTASEARAHLATAVGELDHSPDLAAKCLSTLAQPFSGDTPLPLLTPWLRAADAAITRCVAPDRRIALTADVVGALVATGDVDARRRLAHVPTRGRTLEEQRQIARGHCNLADALVMIGDLDAAARHLGTGTRVADECGARYVHGTARSTWIRLDWLAGAWDGLAERAEAELAEHAGLHSVVAEASLVLTRLALAKGDRVAARRHVVETGVRTPRSAVTYLALDGSACLVHLALLDADTDMAAAEADAGMSLLRRKGVWAWAGDLAPAAVAAYLAAGRVADAEEVARSLAEGIDGRVAPLSAAALHTCHGMLAEHKEQSGAEHHVRAAQAYERMSAPYLAALAWERAQTGATDEAAADVYNRCANTYRDLGATRDAARCRHLLRAMGVTVPSRQGRRGYGNDLSPREREVARLLAAGSTNVEIAEALFLSPRTVEHHASRVLRKLNLASRRDIQGTELP